MLYQTPPPHCPWAVMLRLWQAEQTVARIHMRNAARSRATLHRVQTTCQGLRERHSEQLETIRHDVLDKYREGGSICPNGLEEFLDRHGMEPLQRRATITMEIDVLVEGDIALETDIDTDWFDVTSEEPGVSIESPPHISKITDR